MDTTYVTIMLVVFLVVAGLAIDIGYMYVSDEDLQHSAEIAALTGAQTIKQRILAQAQSDPTQIRAVAGDTVQKAARNAAVEMVSGGNTASALVGLLDDEGNSLSEDNDVTVGFWDTASRSYTAGGTPVNAMQVRTRRTAESGSVGLGSLGSFMAKITGTGTDSFGFTPVAIAALPAGSRANIALCSDVSPASCTYPEICSTPEKRIARAGEAGAGGRYLYTSLLHPVTVTNTMQDMVCHEMPTQEVCGKPVYTATGASNELLRDIEAMMYNPKIDRENKEFDKSGKITGWWVMAPMLECGDLIPGDTFESRTVTRYALVRISRICVSGAVGCQGYGASADAPASACRAGEEGLYIDRISSVDCASKDRVHLPGLHPVLVH